MLTAISPIDGRYRRQVKELAEYYSEYALIRYRIRIEIEYFIALCELPLPQLKDFDHSRFDALRDIYRELTEEQAQEVKDIEKTTNHDVKAVEYFIKRRFDAMDIDPKYKEFVHFGLTSQDINNTAAPLSLLEGIQDAMEGKGRVLYSEGCHLFKDRVEPLAWKNDRLAEAVTVAKRSNEYKEKCTDKVF